MTVGSLFAGIGGIDIGFEQAGFEISWANELDRDACITYRNNFPNVHLIEGDIRALNTTNLSNVDILTAGFPCQPFSVMGYKRGFKDPRGNLFFEITRVIDEKRPQVVFLENVANLMYHDDGKTFQVIFNSLAELGYSVRYSIINATDMNIPQNRSRLYIIAFQDFKMCDCFKFPEPIPLTNTIENIFNRTLLHNEIYYYRENNRHFLELNRKIEDKTGIYRIDDSGVATQKYKICPTLKANMGTYHDRVPIIRDDYGIRKMTPRECLAFQGFPSSFLIKGIPLSSAYKQIGNSVTVPVIRELAKQICKIL